MLSPYEYAYYQYEIASATQSAGFVSGYGSFDDLEIWRSVEGRDYQDELFGRTGNQVQYNANISSGSKMPRADWAFVSEDNYLVPSSRDEQRLIGTTFQQLDNLITLHQRKAW